MSLSLGLNEHHQAQVVAYMRFARYNKVQQMRTIDTCFEDVKCSRLGEDTYTCDEVEDIINGLQQVVHADIESELINMSHTNILMLRQMFQQAENWHLKLQADISELENGLTDEMGDNLFDSYLPLREKALTIELMDKIRDFEDQEFSGKKTESASKVKLLPLNESGGSSLLRMKITEVEEENEKLKEKLSKLETQSIKLLEEKDHLSQEISAMQKYVNNLNNEPQKSKTDIEDMKRLEVEMCQTQITSDNFQMMESDLSRTKLELLKVNEMLSMAEMELEKKVSHTTPFKNLKLMLQKKNEQLKELRQTLSKYEETCDE